MEKSRHYSWLVAVLSSLVAIGVHAYLAGKYYALQYGVVSESSVCNINALWNCDAVSASNFAHFFGAPVAIWGLATNVMFVVVATLSRIGWIDNEERSRRYSLWFAAIILLGSIIMGLISITQLNNLCAFCVLAYVLSIITFIGTWIWTRAQIVKHLGEDISALFKENVGVLGSLVLVPVVAFLVGSAYAKNYEKRFGSASLSLIAQEKVAQWKQSPEKELNPEKGLILQKGQSTPKMTIVEFADFRCPHCKDAYYSLHAFSEAQNDVRFVYKFFPLDGTCNPKMAGGGDGISCEAAFVTHCSEKLYKKGWQTHHYLFDNQNTLIGMRKKEEVRDFVCKNLGVDCAEMAACAENPETRKDVQDMAIEGDKAGVQGTPTIFVNGRLLPYGQLLPVLKEAQKAL